MAIQGDLQSIGVSGPTRTLPFRAMLAGYPNPEDPTFWNKKYWNDTLVLWSGEGYNAVIWYGPNELTNGQHVLLRHAAFPEARELTPEETERRIAQMEWLFHRAKALGLKNVLLTQHLFFTQAFGKAHGLDQPMPVSPTVSSWHNTGYPDFWRGGTTVHCGVRTELTRAYTEAVYAELPQLYPDLDGFYGFLGEPLPGDRSLLFREAIVPGLKRSGRKPLFIALQWQTPMEGYVKNVVPQDVYDNTWLGFHGYNSENITDAKPYPGVVEWSEKTGLPTVVDLYPANQLYFPFNSPRFAYEIVAEMKKVEGFAGFIYWERHISGTLLGPLFRKALAHYASHSEPYSEEPWLAVLEQQFGDRTAAWHFLKAYDLSTRIIPETDALVYSGGDVLRRELRMPYAFFTGEYPWGYTASPARGSHLVPVTHYAEFVALDPERFRDNDGSDPDRPPYYQEALWGSEGGSVFDVIPPVHMRTVRAMGVECLHEAEEGLKSVTKNREAAIRTRDIMHAYQLLAHYYERKVMAAIAALVYARSHRPQDHQDAEQLADEALQCYLDAATLMQDRLDPFYIELTGQPLKEAGVPLSELMNAERKEREELPQIFKWPTQR
ncbi:MAG: hypothetical protein HY710_12890 [Candidatus Latescibacteria bacterium]|nr:hypothetical protein [Candidatus Latescibacterota bacterium]